MANFEPKSDQNSLFKSLRSLLRFAIYTLHRQKLRFWNEDRYEIWFS